MKYEWRKKEKTLYLPKDEPTVIDIEPMNYLTISGEGNPGSEGFSDCVGALYALSYGIRMLNKSDTVPEGYYEYTVFPLEGIWDLNDEGRQLYIEGTPVKDLKDKMIYKVMIRQPDFVSPDLVEEIRTKVLKKKKNERIKEVKFETIKEGKSVQMLHVGSYDDEPASFERMELFAKSQGLVRQDKRHKEIYISDPSKVEASKLKTTIRFWVDEA